MYSFLRKYYIIRTGFAAIAVLLAGLFACDDKGFNPVDPVNYPVYFVDTEKPVIFSYVPATGELDSMPAPFLVKGLKVTPDGKELYISDFNSTIIYDIASGQTVSSGPRIGVRFSPNGQLYAKINARLNEPIQILRRSDDSVIFSDTSVVFDVHFSNDNKRIYGKTLEPGSSSNFSVAYKANLQGDPDIWRKTFPNSISDIIPSPDESQLYVFQEFGHLFEVYHVATDSIIFSHITTPGYGQIAMTPNGSHVFISAPGPFPNRQDPLPRDRITVFDVSTNQIETEIPAQFPFVSDTGTFIIDFPVGQLAVTADGKWLVGLGSLPIGGVIITIDAQTLTVKETVVLGLGRQLSRLTTPKE